MAKLLARTEFAAALKQVADERGINAKAVVRAVEEAVVAAYRRDLRGNEPVVEPASAGGSHLRQDFGGQAGEARAEEGEEETNYEAKLDPVTGGVRIYEVKEDGEKEDVTPPGFGRIATQIAKQVIVQKVREAEKESVISEYEGRVGGLISGMVLRFEGPNVIVDLGRLEAVMPADERVKGENYEIGQRLTFVISEIREGGRGKEVVVSRASEGLVVALFRREVPEVASGAVEVAAIAREAGVRTKLAVASTVSGVDPVGSCVGQKGVRVQAVIDELAGEKIDVIAYTEKVADLIAAALAPATGVRVKVDEEKKRATVVVPEEQLSLAIGKEGQNVRLVAKLTGYKIDIEGRKGEGGEGDLSDLGLSARTAAALEKAGVTSADELVKMNEEELLAISGLGPKSVEEIKKVMARVPTKGEKVKKEKTKEETEEKEEES